MELPFSQACENNKAPIFSVLEDVFSNKKYVLEIGSGTAQHAVHFAQNLPHLTWQTSDLPINHGHINQRVNKAALNNLLPALPLNLALDWPIEKAKYDAMYTANTLHIISEELVGKFFHAAGNYIAPQGALCVYGPFNYQGKFTSDSNANFDLWLKDRDKKSGIRHIESIMTLAEKAGLNLQKDLPMPANNRLLVFIKK